MGIYYLVYAHVSTTAVFDHFDTSSGQDLSYKPIPRSLRPSGTKIQPGKESMTGGHHESIGPQPLGLGYDERSKAWTKRC